MIHLMHLCINSLYNDMMSKSKLKFVALKLSKKIYKSKDVI